MSIGVTGVGKSSLRNRLLCDRKIVITTAVKTTSSENTSVAKITNTPSLEGKRRDGQHFSELCFADNATTLKQPSVIFSVANKTVPTCGVMERLDTLHPGGAIAFGSVFLHQRDHIPFFLAFHHVHVADFIARDNENNTHLENFYFSRKSSQCLIEEFSYDPNGSGKNLIYMRQGVGLITKTLLQVEALHTCCLTVNNGFMKFHNYIKDWHNTIFLLSSFENYLSDVLHRKSKMIRCDDKESGNVMPIETKDLFPKFLVFSLAFLFQFISYSARLVSSLCMLILLAGDVETNPGPTGEYCMYV